MRCLLIAPLHFYNFAECVSAGLRSRGFEVVLENEEYPTGTWGRVAGYFATNYIRKTSFRYFKKLIETEAPFSLIFIIKGRGMSRDLINLFKKNADRVVGYNYDSFEKNPAASEWFRSVDLYMTFDIDDAAKFDLKLVHLFSAAPIFVPQEKKYLVTLIQRRHSDRLKHAKKICDAVPEDRRFIFLYEWSWLTFIVGFLQNPILYFQMRRYISRTPLKYKDAMEKMAESFVTFDYAFPGQSGITVRCFEAQSLGTAILTNNLAAVESGMFQGGSIAYMPPDASSDTISQSLAALATQRPAPRIRALEDFLNDILSATDKLT